MQISEKMQRYGFNKTEQPPILQKNQSMFCDNSFQGIWFFSRRDVEPPGLSPDLLPCNRFLRGYVKAEVYEQRPTTIDGLKAAIRQTANEIPQEMTLRVMEDCRNCLQQYIAVRGSHLENVIFKT